MERYYPACREGFVFCRQSTLYFSRVVVKKKRKRRLQNSLRRKTKKAPAQKSTREETQHVLDWKIDQAVCMTPKYT